MNGKAYALGGNVETKSLLGNEKEEIPNVTFEKMYPYANVNDEIIYNGSTLVKIHTKCSCWNCGELTPWVDLNFMDAPLCSPKCEDIKWDEYFEACKQ